MINKIVSCVGRVVCDLNTRDEPRALAAKTTRKSEKVALEKAKMRYESPGIFLKTMEKEYKFYSLN
jgi:hypothetical protein